MFSSSVPMTTERLEDFVDRHGGRPLQLNRSREMLPDGAIVEHREMAPPFLIEPPPDPALRLKLKIEYHELLLKEAERDFEKMKAALLGGVDESGISARFRWDVKRHGPVQPTERRALMALRRIVIDARLRLAVLRREFDELPEQVEARRLKEEEREMDRRIAERRSKERSDIESITI